MSSRYIERYHRLGFETKLDVLTWMVGFNLVLTVAVLARMLFIR